MKKEEIDDTHAFQETRDLRPLDTLLRRHGWRIRSRPRNGRDLWERNGEIISFEEALASISKAEVERARGKKVEEQPKRGRY